MGDETGVGQEIIGMNGHADPEVGELAQRLDSAGWQIVAEIHSRARVELHLYPALHVWDFSRLGQRFAYGRDDKDAMRRFLRHLAEEQTVESGESWPDSRPRIAVRAAD